MSIQHLQPSDFRRMPWKNGRGSTLELAVFPPQSAPGAFSWRISQANVPESGPFSRFPGYDRVILVLEGQGLLLRHGAEETPAPLDGPAVRLERLEPYAFSGDVWTHGALVGDPVEDFNVMTRRDELRSDVRILRASGALEEGETGLEARFFYAVSGVARVCRADGSCWSMDRGEALLFGGEDAQAPDWEIILESEATLIQAKLLRVSVDGREG